MRGNYLIPSLLFFSLLACQVEGLSKEGDIEKQQLATTGSPTEDREYYAPLAAITFMYPLDDQDTTTRETGYCTGVLVGERTVLTAASCLARNLEVELKKQEEGSVVTGDFLDSKSVWVQFGPGAGSIDSQKYFLDSSFNDGTVTVAGLTMYRYYDKTKPGIDDFALLYLSESPSITPATIHRKALKAAEIEGKTIEFVGYGKFEDSGNPAGFKGRNTVSPTIRKLSYDRIVAGDNKNATCYADSGGPGFFEFTAGSPELVSINVYHQQCRSDTKHQRVDVIVKDFIDPFLNFKENACDGCTACDWNGVCDESCSVRDWDCPLSTVKLGEVCEDTGDCEFNGQCIKATDDDSFLYCSRPCGADRASCPSSMECDAKTKECIYLAPSPGSQGASCSAPKDCRSGYCEGLLCASTCKDSSTCNTDGGFECLSSVRDENVTVCRLEDSTGGGGFCTISPAGTTTSGSRNGFLICFGLLFTAGLFYRRKNREAQK